SSAHCPSLHDALPISRRGGRQVGVRPGRGRRPGPAAVGLLLRDRAMTTTLNDRCNAGTGVEAAFAEVLAEVMRVGHVSVDSHFRSEEHTSELQSPDHL